MFTGTDNDLSADLVKLDYKAMLKTAQIACRWCRVELERQMQTTYDATPSQMRHSGQHLVEAAQHFALATDMLWALEGCETRGELEVVNKPEVGEG